MKITWVNHASFITSHDGIHLICDPWMDGMAFDNGWALLSKTVMPYENFKDITHIWFSHEHPDHFSPPCIAKIPPSYRKEITVLFQTTYDKKVIEYCRKMGFKEVIEMAPSKYYKLSDDFSCSCNHFTDGDAWLHIKTSDHSLLNLNDCGCESLEDSQSILKQLNGSVEVLVTQFGYANRIGNTDEIQLRKAAAVHKLKSIKTQTKVFQPKAIIPFASYVYFCHEDNIYMNDAMNKIGDVYQFIEKETGTTCNVLYPGDSWELTQNHNSLTAIDNYNQDYQSIESTSNSTIIQSQRVEPEVLKKMANQFKDKIKETHGNSPFLTLFTPAKIYVEDYNKSFSFDLKKGLLARFFPQKKCDISLKSDALMYCFTHLWGGDTLQINARFQIPPNGNYAALRQYFKLSNWSNRGIKYDLSKFLKSIIKVQLNRFIKI